MTPPEPVEARDLTANLERLTVLRHRLVEGLIHGHIDEQAAVRLVSDFQDRVNERAALRADTARVPEGRVTTSPEGGSDD